MKEEEAIDRLLEKHGETGTAVGEKNPVYKYVKDQVKWTNLSLENMRKVRSPFDSSAFHYVIHLYGGNNGQADWPSYLKDISFVVEQLDKEYAVWLIELINDCPDDVFDVYIGLENK